MKWNIDKKHKKYKNFFLNNNSSFSIIPSAKKNGLVFFINPFLTVFYYKNKKVILKEGRRFEEKSTIGEIKKVFYGVDLLTKRHHPLFFHLFYDLGEAFLLGEDDLLPDTLLLVEIHYRDHFFYPLDIYKKDFFTSQRATNSLRLKEFPSFSDYQKAFLTGYEELLEGNCYQFNLTFPFEFSLSQGQEYQEEELLNLWVRWVFSERMGGHAHATFLREGESRERAIFLSNSPESLFSLKKKKDCFYLETRPIKGTLPCKDKTEDEVALLAQRLLDSIKDQGELYMITDLLRNDLSAIEHPCAEVLSLKKILSVPGLLHLYSHIRVKLSFEVKLDAIVCSLFPGGSITGAPKKRVMTILKQLEKRERGFYTGSTLFRFRHICEASINIRSLTGSLESGVFSYGAGGGITLLSDAHDEYSEMKNKVLSFSEFL